MDTKMEVPLPRGMDMKMYYDLVGPDPVPFFNLMSSLTTSTGTALSDSETHLQFLCETSPNSASIKLLCLIRSSVHFDLRLKAATLFRHLLGRTSQFWPRFTPIVKYHFKQDILNFVNFEETRPVLEQLRCAVIELGFNLLPDDPWPELLFFIFPAMVSNLPLVQESGLLIFTHLAGLIERSCLPPLFTLRSIIRCSLTNLSGGDVQDVRNAALLAAINLIRIVPPSKDREKLQDLLPYMIFVLLEAFTANQQELVKEAVRRLTLLIAVEPKFICPFLPVVVEAMLQITEFDEVKEELRREAVNLVVTLAKTREKEPVMVEQLVPFVGRVVAILLQMLSDMEDDEAWYTADPKDESKDTDEENNFKYAEKFSNALSASLGGDLIVPVVIKLLLAYLADSDWKKRHAACFFLKEIAKGCFEAMKKNLEQFVNMMVDLFKDTHPRVQGAALIAMRVLSVDLKPDLEAQYHDRIFPAVLQAINTFNRPRVQVEAARTAWNFICCCSKDILKIYLKDLLNKLTMMILTGNRVVQDESLLRDFLPYMGLVMPPLVQSAQSDSELIISSTHLNNTEVITGKVAGEKILDEKASACNMLCCYADELKEDFYPWIDKVAPVLLPFLKLKFHKKVRKAAISAMSKLLRSSKLAVEKGIPDDPEAPCVEVKQLCAKIIPSLIEAMHEEHDIELCCEMVKSLVDCIQLTKS